MMSINEGDWFGFEQKTEAILREDQPTEVQLIVHSKKVIANSRQSLFEPAQAELDHFYELSSKVNDSPIFETLELYLCPILKRNEKDFCGIEELVSGVLAKADMIKVAF